MKGPIEAPSVIEAPAFAAKHGFTTRSGGLSHGAYASLNLGLSSGDEPELVERNRDLLLSQLGFAREQVCAFHQVHGSTVANGEPCWFTDEADAVVTARSDVLLVVSSADCVPLLFHDPTRGVIGAAHCGWRGTAALLAAKVVAAMEERHGSRAADVRVAIGPSMRGDCYQVGPEVIGGFELAGVPPAHWRADPNAEGRYLLDLPGANPWALTEAGVEPENISDMGLCTHCDATRFYSHRRDRGVTGRHWGFVTLANSTKAAG